MLKAIRSTIKPLFMASLAAWTEMRWRCRRAGSRHQLPSRVVVSLTSYPKRYDVLALTLKTLLTQDTAADEVVLWIAHEEMASLPPSVVELGRYGLTIRETANLRSYKKIIPTLEDYSDCIIVTADDDVYYPSSWLSDLIKQYRPGAKEVLCHRAHRSFKNADGYLPYDSWQFEIAEPSSSDDIFFTGVGGVFYPPGAFHKDVGDVAKFLDLCPSTDDVWLNWMVRLNGWTIRKVGRRTRFYEWPGSQAVALQNSNRGQTGGNDVQIANLVREYGFPEGVR
jgi:hypothetical protein